MSHVLGRVLAKPLVAPLASVANLALKVHGRLVLWVGRGDVCANKVDQVPPDADALIAKAISPARVEVPRNASHWAWRMASPQARFDMWEARRGGDQALSGLMVTRLAEPEPGRIACTIMDVTLDESNKSQAMRALLRSVLAHAEQMHAEFILWIGYRQDIESEFLRAGFVRRPGDGLAMSWACGDEALKRAVALQPDWSFNELHTDHD